MAKPLRILGIYREEKYSNRAVDADRAIMDEVLSILESGLKGSVEITKIKPEDHGHTISQIESDIIFSMAQEEQILADLDQLENNGAVLVNSSKAIRNCYRDKLSELLSDEVFSYPRYLSINVNTPLKETNLDALNFTNGVWIKRGDFHALVDEDVVHVKSADQLRPILENFKERRVSKVIMQESCNGELFKFYGVRDNYFNLRYMGKTSNNRYITTSGNPDIKFDRIRLEKLVHMAARVLDLDFFGGDCIVTETGSIHFIDFNDWPSFRTCRTEVAPIMASYALKKLNHEVSLVSNILQ